MAGVTSATNLLGVSKMKKAIAAFMIATAFAPVATPAFADDDPAATTLSAQGDATKGKRIFNRCKACHNLTATERTRMGPNLDNLFGREAGSSEGYKYSKALAEADFVWTEGKLDSWLTQPRAFLPGNKMAFAGLRKEQDRKDLMAYLREATNAGE